MDLMVVTKTARILLGRLFSDKGENSKGRKSRETGSEANMSRPGEYNDVMNWIASVRARAEKEAKQHGRKLTLAARLDAVLFSDQENQMMRGMQGRLMVSKQVVLTGGRGCGKTTAALMFARFLSAQEQRKVFWLDLDEVSSFRLPSPEESAVIFIDDFIGESSSESWIRWRSFMTFYSCIQKSRAHVVLTTRSQLLDKLRSVTGAELNAVVPSSQVIKMTLDHTQLWKEIKIGIKMNKQSNEQKNAVWDKLLSQYAVITESSPSIGFPVCCHLAPYVPANLQGDLFHGPKGVLRQAIKEMIHTNTLAIPALAVLAVTESHMDTYVLLDSEDPRTQYYQRLLDCLQEQRDTQKPTVREIVSFLQNCEGYVQIQDELISFTNEAIREAALVVLLDSHAKFLAEHCSLKLILQITEAPTTEEPWLASIKECAWEPIIDRIISEIGAGNYQEVFASDLFKHDTFSKMFAHKIENEDAVRNWVETFHQSGLHFLFYAGAVDSVWLRAIAFLNKNTDFWIILQAFLGCCYWGRHEDIKNLLDIIKRCDNLKTSLKDATIEQIVTGDLPGLSRRDPPIWEKSPMYPEDTPLTMAAWRGNDAVVTALVERSIDADQRGKHKFTAVMHYCARGNKEITQFLLNQGSDPTSVDDYQLTPIMHALLRGEWTVPDSLWTPEIRSHCDPNCKTTLMMACENGWLLKTVKKLDRLKIDPKLKDDDNRSCLHYACFNGRCPPIVSYLLDVKRLDGNQRSTQNFTPIMFALAGSGSFQVVSELLKSSAVKNAIDKGVIEKACTYSEAKVLELLLQDSRPGDVLDLEALGKACQRGNAEIVRYLISKRNVDPSKAATSEGHTCLHMISLGMSLEVVDMLLDAIDVDALTESLETPLMLALQRGGVDLARHFRFRGAAVDARDARGNTCLHHAVHSGSVRALEWCIEEEHMDVNYKSTVGQTPLHLAVLRNDGRLVKYLLDHGADVLAADNQGNTSFHLAAAQQAEARILNMLWAKADPERWNVKNKVGSSPFDLARMSGLVD